MESTATGGIGLICQCRHNFKSKCFDIRFEIRKYNANWLLGYHKLFKTLDIVLCTCSEVSWHVNIFRNKINLSQNLKII